MNNSKTLQIKTGLRIAKPAADVYEAIANPAHMSHYFISRSSGRMEEGATLEWGFPEMELTFPVSVKKAEPHKQISFTWQTEDGNETLVDIQLQPVSETITFVVITEGEKEVTDAGIKWLKSNTEGWANFLACLKAYLEYGINLRKGAFDPSQMPVQEKDPA
jgi:uncharacterized protein YndB with AHSA1/START domain